MSGANASAVARSTQAMSGANASAAAPSTHAMTAANARAVAPSDKGSFRFRKRGFTLIELMATILIIAVLVGLALPLARNTVKREKEFELRAALREVRTAIDKYKDASDRGLIMVKVDTEGYPESLQILVDGVDLTGQLNKKLKLLRRIPRDPMTNSTEWGMRSYQDDAKSDSWGGQDVFDIYTKSQGTGLDGTKYKEW